MSPSVPLRKISPSWTKPCVVAASGPSLSSEVAHRLGRLRAKDAIRVVAVNDAVYPLWFADLLYACDETWWNEHHGCPGFAGERWSSHDGSRENDKRACAARWGLDLIRGQRESGFSFDPATIHYGENGGFQALNIAGHKIGWRGLIALIGFDMAPIGGRRHFFGEHPSGLRATSTGYSRWPKYFEAAARDLPDGLRIINCTPKSALSCFEMADLQSLCLAA